MYSLEIKEGVDKIFRKLAKKNPKQLKILDKKIQEIQENPHHVYKFLKSPLQKFNRIHIDIHFVLIFKIDYIKEMIVIYYFEHHDKVYQWRPNFD